MYSASFKHHHTALLSFRWHKFSSEQPSTPCSCSDKYKNFRTNLEGTPHAYPHICIGGDAYCCHMATYSSSDDTICATPSTTTVGAVVAIFSTDDVLTQVPKHKTCVFYFGKKSNDLYD